MRYIAERLGNILLSVCAGAAAFVFTLIAFMLLRELNEQIVASITMGLFALLIVWVASEKPNSGHARAVSALIDRLLAVKSGDLTSPAPGAVRREMPALASAVDGLFQQVRSTIDNVHAIALYDPVTSLPNRVHFKREAERMLKSLPPGESLALLFIDLDGFKEVNDSRGHAQGDQLLAMVAERLRIVVREKAEPGRTTQPLLARLAGDEFTLLFPSTGGDAEAEEIARRALSELERPFESGGDSIHISASIGVANCPRHCDDLTSLMKAADIAMYHAKRSGRSQVCVYESEMAEAFRARDETERALREALASGALNLRYEPQLCTRSGAIVAGDASIHWPQADGGHHAQSKFIPLTEQSSLIVPASEWLFAEVAAALARWHRAGIDQRLSFSIGARQLGRPDLLRRLRDALAAERAPKWRLELGFPEAALANCTSAVIEELEALRSDGVSIAIDAFGSGYSNITRLKHVPIDRVKLDRALVAEADTSEAARTILSAIIHLTHGLELQAVAQGVEREEQIHVLRTIGCDMLQGPYFAPAMQEDEFISWLLIPEPRLNKRA